MKRVTTVKVPSKTKEVVKVTCDVDGCGDTAAFLYGGVNYAKCEICKRDLCKRHLVYDPDEPGDYPSKWCSICYGLYYQKRREMQDRHWKEEDALIEKVKKESLKHDKQTNN